jgi:hypothetical protein
MYITSQKCIALCPYSVLSSILPAASSEKVIEKCVILRKT